MKRSIRRHVTNSPNGLAPEAVQDIATAFSLLLADGFALYIKTMNFHWHVSGPFFLSYHRLFAHHAGQLIRMTDGLAERVRKVGGSTIRSIGEIGRLTQICDNDDDEVPATTMLNELREDNGALAERLRQTHSLCEEHGDIASTGLLVGWIDQAEERIWVLFEAGRNTRRH